MYAESPPPGRGKSFVSRKLLKKIKKGGVIGDKIRAKRERHHIIEELPQAEEEFQKSINLLNAKKSNKVKKIINKEEKIEKTFFKKIIDFLKKFFKS